MTPEFQPVSGFPRGTLFLLLADAYSFDPRCGQHWSSDWREFDDFFFDHPQIADRCGFLTVLAGRPAGFVSWDPRCRPERVVIGHNCIATAFQGRGLGVSQLREAVRRILCEGETRISVTTSAIQIPAQKMYLRAGFREIRRRPATGFAGELIDYGYHSEQF